MKIKIYGEKNQNWLPAQMPLIRRGLLELNHELVENPADADTLFAADPNGYKQITIDKIQFNKPSCLTIHDIPEYQSNKDEIINEYSKYLEQVDAIAVNSYTTQAQVKRIFNRESFIIYQPCKPIIPLNIPKTHKKLRFLFVGRAASLNKRFHLVKELITKYYDESQLAVIGSENPGFGNFAGLVGDEQLLISYNMADFILSPSSYEGLGLVACESLLANVPPIVCNDCLASLEFAEEFACDPTADAMYEKIQEIQSNKKDYDWIIQQYYKKYKEQFSYISVAQNISNLLESL